MEEIFGWVKPVLSVAEGIVGGGQKIRYIGVARDQLRAELTAAAYNLVRMVKLTLVSLEMPREECAQ